MQMAQWKRSSHFGSWQRGFIYSLLAIAVFLSVGCSNSWQTSELSDVPSPGQGSETDLGHPGDKPEDKPTINLSWNKSGAGQRRDWTETVVQSVSDQFESLDRAEDMARFCPRYDSLTRPEKIAAWSQLIVAISYFESGWNPTTRFHESTMGTDPVTRQPVYSEGLLQLSYQDIQWATYCEFDWNRDKNLDPRDPTKTILDPHKNLRCGIRILADQIARRKAIVLSRGVYWAVIREGGRYQKINQIAQMVQQHESCR